MDQESVLFIQPRYHTNLYPVVEALVKREHNVSMLVFRESTTGESEKTQYVAPDVIRFSLINRLLNFLLGSSFSNHILYLYCFPSLYWYFRYLWNGRPDIIVIREYSATALLTILYGRFLGCTIVYYDQTPANAQQWGIRRSFIGFVHLLFYSCRPTRYSPIKGASDNSNLPYHSYYIPFAMEPSPQVGNPSKETVRVLMIGKLHQPRKNHILFLQCIVDLVEEYELQATIIGSLNSSGDEHYQRILSYIDVNILGEIARVESNLPYAAVQAEYSNHDIFVLPSDDERAAVSHLEAMAHGLAVICSDANGTKDYIKSGYNGYVFESGNYHDLRNKLDDLIRHTDKRVRFSVRSVERTEAEFSQAQFYDRFSTMVEEVTNRESKLFG